ncbi:hypothetical protein EFQ99_19545 [Rhizobium vallis]|uniref:Uncharacterized protein n=1 Tax=Rhizobium vallis TaxID=634290 RepID=A0A3S0SQ73_9HYPH|nr:dimethylsulfonioproprionate lyase family protein [Rhizobium vallis]RUM24141.1 hypothetical protein EFQ99_19545 [Rhizobium vallis]
MFAPIDTSFMRCVDPFLRHSSVARHAGWQLRIRRPAAIQAVIDALGDVLMNDEHSMMVRFTGCKIVHRLQEEGTFGAANTRVGRFALADEVSEALSSIGSDGPVRVLADALRPLAAELDWYQGRGGPFASVNFPQAHAHAVIVGPIGLEERSDVRCGITILAPYTRFPDHEQTHSRVVIPIGIGEFRSDAGEWAATPPGSTIFCATGSTYAMRSTSCPLLTVWCQKLSR